MPLWGDVLGGGGCMQACVFLRFWINESYFESYFLSRQNWWVAIYQSLPDQGVTRWAKAAAGGGAPRQKRITFSLSVFKVKLVKKNILLSFFPPCDPLNSEDSWFDGGGGTFLMSDLFQILSLDGATRHLTGTSNISLKFLFFKIYWQNFFWSFLHIYCSPITFLPIIFWITIFRLKFST